MYKLTVIFELPEDKYVDIVFSFASVSQARQAASEISNLACEIADSGTLVQAWFIEDADQNRIFHVIKEYSRVLQTQDQLQKIKSFSDRYDCIDFGYMDILEHLKIVDRVKKNPPEIIQEEALVSREEWEAVKPYETPVEFYSGEWKLWLTWKYNRISVRGSHKFFAGGSTTDFPVEKFPAAFRLKYCQGLPVNKYNRMSGYTSEQVKDVWNILLNLDRKVFIKKLRIAVSTAEVII